MKDWQAISFGGLFCVPILAIGVMAIIDIIGGLILGLKLLWEYLR